MKIGIDGRLWGETGVGRYIRNLVRELQVIDKKNEYVLFLRSKDLEQFKAYKNWKVEPCDIQWHSLYEQIKLPQILNGAQVDLMHFPYFSVPIFYNKPFVVTIHDLIVKHFPTGKASTLPYPVYKVKRIGYNRVIDHAVKDAKKIIVPLNAVKVDVVNTFHITGKKIAVTHEGADPLLSSSSEHSESRSSGSPRLRSNSNYFLYVGNAYPHKNLERLIDAYAALKSEMKEDVQLVFVGGEDFFYKRLHELVKRKNISGITFEHNATDEELFSLYSQSIALVSPSLMEGFGLTPLEAMAASSLIVLSGIPAFREVCKDVAIYFDPYSVEDITEKMKSAYKLDPKIRKKYIEKGIARSKEFSWKKMAEETLKVYESSISI